MVNLSIMIYQVEQMPIFKGFRTDRLYILAALAGVLAGLVMGWV